MLVVGEQHRDGPANPLPEHRGRLRIVDKPEVGDQEHAEDLPACWTRGGLTVTSLREEFSDPAWEPRGKYRALKQFIMNWNNWPSQEDRSAMLDGPPPDDMPEDEQARIAAVVHCLCDRDGHPLPDWVKTKRARRRGGVSLIRDQHHRSRVGTVAGYDRLVKRETPKIAWRYRVWFLPETLEAR